MANANKFIQEYGDISFTEKPFCDADNVALCRMFYMPLEKVAPNNFTDEPMAFDEVCNRMYAYNGNKNVAPGLVLTKGISVMMMKMAKCRRYAEMKVVACTETFREKPAVQFGAVTLLLPDGTVVVLFRGTDDTLIGWKEDFDIYSKKGVPSHKLAVDYLNTVGKMFDGDIIVCGHSKGGNVALYGALYCDESVRERIEYLYNNDGPGFYSFDYINSDAYKELLPRYKHFVPDNSFVGMLLAHDDDYVPVKSSRFLGPLQHDLVTWQIKDDTVIKKDDLRFLAKVSDIAFFDLVFNTSDEQLNALDRVLEACIEAMNVRGLLDFAKSAVSSAKSAKNTFLGMDEETKEALKSALTDFPDIIKGAIEMVRNQAFPEASEKVRNLAKAVTV
ncbi:MAG: Mbeg1-like protein [Acutalibacteraceae bacterium]